jgi:hypothetical protein
VCCVTVTFMGRPVNGLSGLAHADETKLVQLRAEGFPLVLGTYRRWHRDLDVLAANLDAETAIQLGRLFDRKGPW